MFNGSYEKPLTMTSHVQGSAQTEDPTSSSRGMYAATDLPSSDIEFQLYGTRCDVSQPGLQYQDVAQAPPNATTFQHPIHLCSGNPDYMGGIHPSCHEQWSQRAAPASISRGPGFQPGPIPYGQPSQWPMGRNMHSDQTGEPGFSSIGHPVTVSTCLPNLQPPSVYREARLNTQGVPTPILQLSQSWVDYEDDEGLRLIIQFKKIRPS